MYPPRNAIKPRKFNQERPVSPQNLTERSKDTDKEKVQRHGVREQKVQNREHYFGNTSSICRQLYGDISNLKLTAAYVNIHSSWLLKMSEEEEINIEWEKVQTGTTVAVPSVRASRPNPTLRSLTARLM